ncbi:anoctamin-8 [Manacus vitellinus]|uniref:anoctamin-8 n=1 Tax=Manacus vitellinus TaxID=328815 RepID=UPI00115EB00F|nr:anoctamin-8 [Manacus vitellinus]
MWLSIPPWGFPSLHLVPSVPQTSQDISCVVFAIFNVIWATLFLEEWKRRGAEFAYKWGTLDTPPESIEEPRPQFRGVKRISPVTSAEEFYYPPWKRLLFQCLVSLPVCLACLTLVFLLMLGCFQLQEFVLSIQELPRIIRFLPKIILAVIVTACDELYKKVAYWLNDMENYRLQSDTFQDYQEMFIQFGYVVLFSSAFPLAAVCALVNNVIEIRSDAFKLCTGLQRPFGQRVESIGQWQKVMEAMGVLAIVVNCYLIAQCGQLQRLFPWLSPEGAIISVVVLEHFALFLKYIIQVAIPDIPAWVAEEMAKLEYQRREAFKHHGRSLVGQSRRHGRDGAAKESAPINTPLGGTRGWFGIFEAHNYGWMGSTRRSEPLGIGRR